MTYISQPKESYSAPDLAELDVLCGALVCNSPGDGENEDVGFEDW